MMGLCGGIVIVALRVAYTGGHHNGFFLLWYCVCFFFFHPSTPLLSSPAAILTPRPRRAEGAGADGGAGAERTYGIYIYTAAASL